MLPYIAGIHHRQEGDWFCFLACMQTFLEENGIKKRQNEIMAVAPDIFGANPNDLGGFHPENFGRLEAPLGFKAEMINAGSQPPSLARPKESFFVLCYWNNDPKAPHWVRLIGMHANHVLLMNPKFDHHPDSIALTEFASWPKSTYKLTML